MPKGSACTLLGPNNSKVLKINTVWHANMMTLNGLVAVIMYRIKLKTICDHDDLKEKMSGEKCARTDILLKL